MRKATVISSSSRPEVKQATINDARKRVKKALVERASQAAAHCKVIVEALTSLRRLQTEVRGIDTERHALKGKRSSKVEYCDLSGEFIHEKRFTLMEDYAHQAMSNAERLIKEEEADAEDDDDDEEADDDDDDDGEEKAAEDTATTAAAVVVVVVDDD